MEAQRGAAPRVFEVVLTPSAIWPLSQGERGAH
jgi:hypothetical protein